MSVEIVAGIMNAVRCLQSRLLPVSAVVSLSSHHHLILILTDKGELVVDNEDEEIVDNG